MQQRAILEWNSEWMVSVASAFTIFIYLYFQSSDLNRWDWIDMCEVALKSGAVWISDDFCHPRMIILSVFCIFLKQIYVFQWLTCYLLSVICHLHIFFAHYIVSNVTCHVLLIVFLLLLTLVTCHSHLSPVTWLVAVGAFLDSNLSN